MKTKKSFLIILDGWGLGQDPTVDAIASANTPFYKYLVSNYVNQTLVTYGEEVGLPEGQMGNSEVGHLNIGAGRIVDQELVRINKACRDNTLIDMPVMQDLVAYAKNQNKAVHLLGLVSDGGVHSHIDHLKSIVDSLDQAGVQKVYIHAFMDGRDTGPHAGKEYLSDLSDHCEGKTAKIASVVGRYYAMDRDNRYERIKIAYDLLVHGTGSKTDGLLQSIERSYDDGVTDEFIDPISVQENGKDVAHIENGDAILFYNFRTDRPRQLTTALSQKNFPEYELKKLNLHFATMTIYDESFEGINVVFTKDKIAKTIGEVVSHEGLTQLRIAETEKYPHVTFFFSGGREQAFEGEERILIPSPKVATYDLQPQMSAEEITNRVCEHIESEKPDFICLNYANTDMVGHTGIMEAAIKATETVDECLKRAVTKALEHDYEIVIIADHGNSDIMRNSDGSAHTAHTTNLVPIIYVSNSPQGKLNSGRLGDIAPTLLKLMHIEQPSEMTGKSLVE